MIGTPIMFVTFSNIRLFDLGQITVLPSSPADPSKMINHLLLLKLTSSRNKYPSSAHSFKITQDSQWQSGEHRDDVFLTVNVSVSSTIPAMLMYQKFTFETVCI